MNKTLPLFVCLLALVITANAQTSRPYLKQFFYNPYLFNPAYVGINQQPEVNLVYRQQWSNFKDAPVTAGVNLQYPTKGRVALGFNFTSDKQVLVRNTSVLTTFGYVVPIDKKQALRFALSAGVGLNKLDLTADELAGNDPVLTRAAGNNYYIDGNFGVVYTNGGFRLGFALTDLFRSNTFNPETFNQFKMSNLKNRLFSMSYRFEVGFFGNVAVEPYLLYRQTEDGLQDSWEAATTVTFFDKVWTGASYNQHNGLALFLGLNVKDRFRFSYSYEFPPMNTNFTNASSQELHLGVRFGKKAAPRPVSTSVAASSKKTMVAPVETEHKLEETDSTKLDAAEAATARATTTADATTNATSEAPTATTTEMTAATVAAAAPGKTPAETKATKTPSRPRASFTLERGHYVVVGVFAVMDHSMKFTREMMQKGYGVNVALHPRNNLYYVYIFSTYDVEEARKQRNDYRWKNLFKDCWVMTVE